MTCLGEPTARPEHLPITRMDATFVSTFFIETNGFLIK